MILDTHCALPPPVTAHLFPDSEVSSPKSSHLFICYIFPKPYIYISLCMNTHRCKFLYINTCVYICTPRYADKCLITGFLGGSHFIVFSDFHDINIPPWSMSWYQSDVTGLGGGEECIFPQSFIGPVVAASQHRQFIHIYIYIHIHTQNIHVYVFICLCILVYLFIVWQLILTLSSNSNPLKIIFEIWNKTIQEWHLP